MFTMTDLLLEISKIRNEADSIEVKGTQNMAIIIRICERCDALINNLETIAKLLQNENKSDEEGGTDAG